MARLRKFYREFRMRHTAIRLIGMVWIAMFAPLPAADAGAMPVSKSSLRRSTPAVPAGLKVVLAGDRSVSLDWDDNSDTFGHYQVYRNNKLIADGPSASSHVDSGLTNGQAYSYRVSAGADPTYSAWTSPISATPTGATTTPPPTTTADLWQPNLTNTAIGFTPTSSGIPGFNVGTWDIVNGGKVDVQYAADGVTKAFRAYIAAGSDTQRAEQVPTYDPGGSGTTFWLGYNVTFPAYTVSSGWGPLIMQMRRDQLGNGPISMNIHSGHIVAEGYSGVPSEGSSIDLGPVPSPGSTVRIVLGVYLHPSSGWVEGWRDGSIVKRVSPWVSKDTSSTGVGTTGSTLPSDGDGVSLKLGAYRGGSSSPVDIRFSDLRAATTRSGVQ